MDDTISTYMRNDHQRCDRLLAVCEAESDSRNWAPLKESADAFSAAMERHFRIEEEILFPELEKVAAQSAGPTSVMRMEHSQMRQLLADLGPAVRQHDRDRCLGILETLHMFVQQHNAKEEGVLYPLAERSLSTQAPAIFARVREL